MYPKQLIGKLLRLFRANEEAVNEAVPVVLFDLEGKPVDGLHSDPHGYYVGTAPIPNWALTGDVKPLLDAANLLWGISAKGGNLAGGETLTLTLYRKGYSGTTEVDVAVGTITATVPAVLDGAWGFVAFTDTSNLIKNSTHYKVTGTIVVGAGTTATGAVIRTKIEGDLDAVVDQLVIANGHLAVIRSNTAPLVVSTAGGYVRQDSNATIAKETGGNLATVKTNTDPLVAGAAGGYIRQDSNATIAKETGGHLEETADHVHNIDGAIGAATDSPVTSLETVEDGTARSSISLLKRIVNMIIGWAAAKIQRYRVSGADTYWATGTRVDATSFTFTPDTRVTSVTDDKIVQIVQRSSTGAWVTTPLGTVHITGAGAPYTCTVTGASFTAGDLIQICMRGTPRSHTDATNSDRTAEISPVDTRSVNYNDLGANFDVADGAVKYVSSGANAPTWYDTHSLNANGGKAGKISAVVTCTVLAGDTAHFWMIASNDSANAGASKRYAEVYASGVGTGEEMYLKNGVEIGVAEGVVNSVTWTNGTAGTVTYTFTINVDNFDERYFDFGCGAVGGQIDNWYVDVAYSY